MNPYRLATTFRYWRYTRELLDFQSGFKRSRSAPKAANNRGAKTLPAPGKLSNTARSGVAEKSVQFRHRTFQWRPAGAEFVPLQRSPSSCQPSQQPGPLSMVALSPFESLVHPAPRAGADHTSRKTLECEKAGSFADPLGSATSREMNKPVRYSDPRPSSARGDSRSSVRW